MPRRYATARRPYLRARRQARSRAPRRTRLAAPSIRSTRLLSQGMVHLHKRHAELATIICDEVNNSESGNWFIGKLFALQFSLQDVSSESDFVQLYRWYKFGFVELTFTVTNTPVQTDFDTASAPHSTMGNFSMWVDLEDYDATAPADAATFLQRGNIKQLHFDMRKGNSIKLRLRPSVLGQVYNTLTTSAFTRGGRPWLTTNYPGVPHYGVTGLIRGPIMASTAVPDFSLYPTVKVEAMYYLAFKKTQ